MHLNEFYELTVISPYYKIELFDKLVHQYLIIQVTYWDLVRQIK